MVVKYGKYFTNGIRNGKGIGIEKVSGVQETIGRITRIQDRIPRIAATSLLVGAEVVSSRAKELCPVITGNLMRSIHPELVSNTQVLADIQVGTDVEYGPFIELGTVHMAAEPYLRPALDQTKDQVQHDVASAFQTLIRGESSGA